MIDLVTDSTHIHPCSQIVTKQCQVGLIKIIKRDRSVGVLESTLNIKKNFLFFLCKMPKILGRKHLQIVNVYSTYCVNVQDFLNHSLSNFLQIILLVTIHGGDKK